MPMLRRVGVLLLSQATSPQPEEDVLLRHDIVRYVPAATTTPGANSTNVADLRGDVRAFHKPVSGVDGSLASQYGHDEVSVALNECSAWRLARFLGAPFTTLVPTTVLRYLEASQVTRLQYPGMADGWGSLASLQPGVALDPTPIFDPAFADAAAFFDALVAQQDRHPAQYRWDADAGRLGLIDHGFAFARPGDPLNDSVFLYQRRVEGRAELTESERVALAAIADADLVGLGDILDPGQADALRERIRRMRASGRLLDPGDW